MSRDQDYNPRSMPIGTVHTFANGPINASGGAGGAGQTAPTPTFTDRAVRIVEGIEAINEKLCGALHSVRGPLPVIDQKDYPRPPLSPTLDNSFCDIFRLLDETNTMVNEIRANF